MMRFEVRDSVFEADPLELLYKLKSELYNGKLADIHMQGGDISVTCPHHAGGLEKHNSCTINLTSDTVPLLFFHCFTCGESGSIDKFIGDCFDKSANFGYEWLCKRYLVDKKNNLSKAFDLKPINMTSEGFKQRDYLSEDCLDQYEDYHPYMTKRKLNKTIKQFGIKYDPRTRSIVFPTRDINGKLTGISRRSVDGKRFDLGIGMSKEDIFLLHEANKYKYCVVCESQINALTCWEHNIPAIALYGAGTTKSQMEILNKSNITTFFLAYDNDKAGDHGRERFKNMLRKNKITIDLFMPVGKDVNDLSEEEFNKYIKEIIC